MNKVDMIDKMGQELRLFRALFTLIEYAAQDQASCDAISDVSHWMSGHIENLQQFVESDLAHALGVNLPDEEKKAA